MYINERVQKHEAHINGKARKLCMVSTKPCSVSIMVQNSQSETSSQPVNDINKINKVKNVVLKKSARVKQKYCSKCDETSVANDVEKFSPAMKRQKKH